MAKALKAATKTSRTTKTAKTAKSAGASAPRDDLDAGMEASAARAPAAARKNASTRTSAPAEKSSVATKRGGARSNDAGNGAQGNVAQGNGAQGIGAVKGLASQNMPIDIGISDKNRQDVANELSKMLADSYTLYLMTHNFHWNVTGPMFSTLHQMFMDQYTEQWQALDDIAERIRALGHYAPGTYADYARLSSIQEPKSVPTADEMIQMLVKGNEAVAKTARAAFERADNANDQPTADLLTQRLDVHEKNAWMLRSLLQ